MLKTAIKPAQNDLYHAKLEDTINLKHELCLLSSQIPWDEFDKEYERYYTKIFGRPAKPIRLMVSLLILKYLYKESDETVVKKWMENPYWQYFSSEDYFQWQYTCNPTELLNFHKRIGEEGVEKIFSVSIKLHGIKSKEQEVVATISHLKW